MRRLFKDKKQIVDYCFYLFIAVLPFTLILAPIAIGLLIASFLFFGNKDDMARRFKQNKAVLILIAFYMLHVVGLFFSVELGIDYGRIDTQLLLFLVPVVFLALDLNLEHINKAKKVYILACIGYCLLALATLLYNLIVNFEHRMDYNFVQTSMYHYHYPYDVLYVNAAYILLLFNSHLNRYKLAISILFFVIVVLSGVRMGLAIFLLITGIYLVLNFKRVVNLKSMLILLGIFILSVVLIKNSRYVNDKFFDSLSKIGFNTEKYVSDIGEKYHKLTLRQKLWNSAKEAFNDSPNKVIGYGPQGSRDVLNQIYANKNYDINGMNSHNQYLTTTLNNGILGTIILLAIFLLGIIQSLKIRSIQNTLIIFIIAMAFLTESMLERQKGVAFFAIFMTIIFIEAFLRRKANSNTP